MNRLKLAIVIGFAIVFVAGLSVGKSWGPLVSDLRHTTPTPTTKPSEDHFPTIGRELNLTSEQRQQMESIWKEARVRSERSRQFMLADQERDAAIHALLTPEQQTQYAQIQHDHEARISAVRAEVSKAMHDAEEKTRAILTPVQRAKFDQILKEHQEHGHHGPRPFAGPPAPNMGGHHHRHSTSSPDTAPSEFPDTAPVSAKAE